MAVPTALSDLPPWPGLDLECHDQGEAWGDLLLGTSLMIARLAGHEFKQPLADPQDRRPILRQRLVTGKH